MIKTYICNRCASTVSVNAESCDACGAKLGLLSDAVASARPLPRVIRVCNEGYAEFSIRMSPDRSTGNADIFFELRPKFTKNFNGCDSFRPSLRNKKPIPLNMIVETYDPTLIRIESNCNAWDEEFGKIAQDDLWKKIVLPALTEHVLAMVFYWLIADNIKGRYR